MATGKVKWFNAEKRYGFIIPDSGGDDVFVHASALDESEFGALIEGQRVSYELADRGGRPCAVRLRSAAGRAA